MRTQTATEVIGHQVARTRQRRGWTQQRLAQEVAELGGKIGRGAVAKIESGVRGVSLDEALQLGAALRVPPSWLLTPHEARALLEVAPELHAQAWAVRGWLAGRPLEAVKGDDEATLFALMPEEEVAVHRRPGIAALRQLVTYLADAALSGSEDRMRRHLAGIERETARLRDELGA